MSHQSKPSLSSYPHIHISIYPYKKNIKFKNLYEYLYYSIQSNNNGKDKNDVKSINSNRNGMAEVLHIDRDEAAYAALYLASKFLKFLYWVVSRQSVITLIKQF